MQNSLPPSWVARAASQAEWLLNRFPVTSQDISVPMDGDQARPLELCNKSYSRRQIDKELSYFIPIGTPALVHDTKAKGSTLGPKSFWAIAIGMYREQVIFWNPYKDSTLMSKSFTAFKLRQGMSFADFLRLPAMPTTKRMAAIPSDFNEKVVIQLPEITSQEHPALPPVEKVTVAHDGEQMALDQPVTTSQRPLLAINDSNHLVNNTHHGHQRVRNHIGSGPIESTDQNHIGMEHKQLTDQLTNNTGQPPVRQHGLREAPIITTLQPMTQLGRELGGSVELLDSDGSQLVIDPETGILQRTNTICDELQTTHDESNKIPVDTETGVEAISSRDKVQHDNSLNQAPDHSNEPCVVVRNSERVQQLFDEADAQSLNDRAITTGAHHTFIRICRQHKLPKEQHHLYRRWITLTQKHPHGRKLTESDLPTARGKTLPPNLHMPLPSGRIWRSLCQESLVQGRKPSHEDINEQMVREATQDIRDTLRQQKHSYRATGIINLSPEPEFRLSPATLDVAYAAKKKRKRSNDTGEPANTLEALEGEHYQEWIESCEDEIQGLIRMGVLDTNGDVGGYTRQELIDKGITSKPVPIGLYHTHKTGKDGEVTRRKTRAAVQGHKGNMQKGIHFTETFAATPNEDTSRFLTCLTIALNLRRKSCDIVKAYCWAPVPDGELIALAYPDGYKQRNQNGEILYAIMRQNLYGHPGAARNWQRERDDKILTVFNSNGWTCKRTVMDPCLFEFKSPEGALAWALIHTDDVDAVGEDDTVLSAIFTQLNNIWEIKETDSEYMLGISRKLTIKSDKVHNIECTMTPFIQGAVKAFSDHIIPADLKVPFPENVKISKLEQPDDTEVKEVLALGYQRAVGIILWAARHCYPECKYGISKLCSVMARPSYTAFKAAMHMISYLGQNQLRGIQFNADGNKLPIVCSDASNKADPATGCSHGGFTITWFGGPLAFQSKRLAHVGHSSAHNEYMAITAAIKRTVWLRQLISELSACQEVLAQPTVVLGDNTQANRLCREHFITPGNQYIALSYHYNKEQVELGTVTIRWLASAANIADLMTKPVSRQVLNKLLGALTGYSSPQQLQDLLCHTEISGTTAEHRNST